MTLTMTNLVPELVLGTDREELIERMRATQARKRAQGSRLTFAGLIDRLDSYTGIEGREPAAFWLTPADSRAVDRLTAAAVMLTGRSDTDALRELVESIATLHRMRPADVLQMRVQSAVALVA